MLRIHLPMNSRIISSLYKKIDPYLSFFTLYQSWNMYSPNPSRTNVYLTAKVEFDDGSKDIYEFPRVDRMNIIEKYAYGERMRVMTESIRVDKNQFLWRDASKFALRKLRENNYTKIPIRVDLYRHWNTSPHPKQTFRPHLSKAKNYEKYKFYTYEVL
jgi:hypothetical protein